MASSTRDSTQHTQVTNSSSQSTHRDFNAKNTTKFYQQNQNTRAAPPLTDTTTDHYDNNFTPLSREHPNSQPSHPQDAPQTPPIPITQPSPRPPTIPQHPTPAPAAHRVLSDHMLTVIPTHIPVTDLVNATIHAWHVTLNHGPLQRLAAIAKPGVIPGPTPTAINTSMSLTCSACADDRGKQAPHKRTTHDHHRTTEVISSDTVGPIQPPSQLAHRYILTLLDAASRFAIYIPIRSRADLSHLTPNTIQDMTALHNRTPRRFHSDNDREYHAANIYQSMSGNGIAETFTTTTYQPQANSFAERFNRSLMETACALHQAKLRISF